MPGWRSTDSATARLTIERDGDRVALAFSGRLTAAGAGALWRPAIRAATHARGQGLRCDLAAVETFDMVGAVLLLAVERAHAAPIELIGADAQVTAVVGLARKAASEAAPPSAAPPSAAPPSASPPSAIPPSAVPLRVLFPVLAAGLSAAANAVAFLGEAVLAIVRLPARTRMLRLGDLLRQADQAGARALPLVMLLGFLMGTILAFQSVVPMRPYGADLFVVNLVTVSLLRELGALLSAVILAGRTGSAFAAEIGTMKVNRELDALVTMGLDPMTLLVLPRLIAVMLVLPALALVLDLAGLFGMATVMHGFGFPMPTIVHQVQLSATLGDLLGGLFKAVCFAAAIAAIGCQAGLSTGHGPRAVGLSATAAVVGGIVSTIALDGLLAVIFYRLDL
jgi:phospholipid/cholesterol/gamma-HCH transport system permease protein